MADIGSYHYVDFASKALPGFRNRIVLVEGLPSLIREYGHADCYCTYFLFDDGLRRYANANHHSVAQYNGPCYAHFLPLDIDSHDLEHALQTARQISLCLLDNQGIPEEAIAAYYSGMKGFHVALATAVFGNIQPGPDLPRIFHEVRRSIVERARVRYPETVDFGICDRLRLLRLPNTKHGKSGLYKVPLHAEELLSCGIDEILDAARKPRRLWLTDESGLVPRYQTEPVAGAVELFECCTEQAKDNPPSNLPDPGRYIGNGNPGDALCQAEHDLYREGVPEGSRSALCLRLASRFRSAGYPEGEAVARVTSFAGRCQPPLDEHDAGAIVRNAYRANGRGYQFGCGNGKGDVPQAKLVHDRCPYRNDRTGCRSFRQFYLWLNGNGKRGGG
jgi:hypothetical protein